MTLIGVIHNDHFQWLENKSIEGVIYEKTATFGHFGRKSDEDGYFTWEKLDKVNEFKALL